VIRRPARDNGGSRLTGRDLLRVGSLGLRSRRVRALLSALGISIGIAAIVGVLGISRSSQAGLLAELGRLGNLLTVQPASTATGQQAELPVTAEGMVSRIGPVTSVTEIASIPNRYVYRTPFIPAIDTSGIALTAADPALPATLGITVAHGAFLSPATARYPAVVLGAAAASLLGIRNLAHPTQVWIGGHWFTVTGILSPVAAENPLVTQMDSMAFIGFPVAGQFLAEAVLLSLLGGLAGTVIGVLATAIYAYTQHWQVQIPAQALYGGTGAALAIGAIAGGTPERHAPYATRGPARPPRRLAVTATGAR
jgi:putative ABC transport system permease protein